MSLPAFDTAGSGRSVLLLHAFPLSRRMWDPQVDFLAASCQVLRFDARGFGETPSDSGGSGMDRIADDAAMLLDHLGIGASIVVGCSMGSYAAFALQRRHPSRLAGLVLVSSRAGSDTEEARAGRAKLAERVRTEGAPAAEAAFLPRLVGETTKKERGAVAEEVRAMILSSTKEAIASALLSLGAREDSSSTLAQIKVPTLVLCGAEDAISPPKESEAIHRGISRSRLVVVEGAGHLPNLERPEAFNAALGAFLGGFTP